jgi:rubrerythrin
MSDYIKRQDAIDAVKHAWAKGIEPSQYIESIEPADVVPMVHGTWEHHMSFGICDKCGYEYNWTGTDAKNFCPNCGAKMDGGDEHG